MTPALQTLAVESGLAREFAVVAPDGARAALWKVLVDIGLGDGSDYPLAHVGAYDLGRRRALERGAGEAVERFALAREAPPEVRGTLGMLRAEADTEVWWPRWVCADAFRAVTLGWYRAIRMADSQPVLVPAHAVDDDGGRRHRSAGTAAALFDPSPSGAAAGLDADSAARAALLEVIERDAVLCAWGTGIGVGPFEPAGADPDIARLASEAERVGLRPVFGTISGVAAGVHVICCAIVDRSAHGALVSFGSKAAESVGAAARGALQEALQIHELLDNLRTRVPRPAAFDRPDPALVVDDVARAWWWTTDAAADSMEDWIAAWSCTSRPSKAAAGAPTVERLVAEVTRDGGSPILVDLTARLPRPIRALGWHAVKVVCPGYQQLRLDESLDATWDRTRLTAWGHRHGAPPRALSTLPHPLI
ncbi:YcaO-like family protein [Microbacterium sp. PMB16]|uniref:YcaO-like family protein n=1 Tax=Microbacterium sp. PMB16 TaxID=3120157 RepID=UPI003F4BF67E